MGGEGSTISGLRAQGPAMCLLHDSYHAPRCPSIHLPATTGGPQMGPVMETYGNERDSMYKALLRPACSSSPCTLNQLSQWLWVVLTAFTPHQIIPLLPSLSTDISYYTKLACHSNLVTIFCPPMPPFFCQLSVCVHAPGHMPLSLREEQTPCWGGDDKKLVQCDEES